MFTLFKVTWRLNVNESVRLLSFSTVFPKLLLLTSERLPCKVLSEEDREFLQSVQLLKVRWKHVEVSSIKRFIIWRYLWQGCRAIISSPAEQLYWTKSHNIRASVPAQKQIHSSHMLKNTRWPPVSEPKVNSAATGTMIKTGESCQEFTESLVCCFAAAGFSLNNKLFEIIVLIWSGLLKINSFPAGQRHLRQDFSPNNIHINTWLISPCFCFRAGGTNCILNVRCPTPPPLPQPLM